MRTIAVVCAAASVSVAWSRPRRVAINLPEPGSLIAALASFLLGWTAAAALRLPGVVALVIGGVAAVAPALMRRHGRERASRRETQRWPDFLGAVRSRLATGAALPAARGGAGRRVGGGVLRLPPPAGGPLAPTTPPPRGG